MPARSKAQQRAAGAALAAKRGEGNPDDLAASSRGMFESMTEAELEELAGTRLDDLPDRVEDEAEGHPT